MRAIVAENVCLKNKMKGVVGETMKIKKKTSFENQREELNGIQKVYNNYRRKERI